MDDARQETVFRVQLSGLYSDSTRGIYRELIKDCDKVDLTVVERCLAQRIDMTTSAKGVLTGGYIKFIIWARHNGVYSW